MKTIGYAALGLLVGVGLAVLMSGLFWIGDCCLQERIVEFNDFLRAFGITLPPLAFGGTCGGFVKGMLS